MAERLGHAGEQKDLMKRLLMAQHVAPISELIAGALRAVAIGSVIGAWSAIAVWSIGICGTGAIGAEDFRSP